jgi:lipoyl(octanoyl) transferase
MDVTADRRRLEVRRLGLVPYRTALDLQAGLVEQRKAGAIPDQLLLLEHPPVVTVGVKARNDRSHILADAATLQREGVEVLETSRGGDVTYHGPGQLVGYPIIDLKPDRQDVHRYVRDLEKALIGAVAAFGVTAGRMPGMTGVWVGDEKLAAIGVRISRWVTSHGFALNLDPKLSHFDLIVPCGITDKGVTSLARLVSPPPSMDALMDAVTASFQDVFGSAPEVAAGRPRSSQLVC